MSKEDVGPLPDTVPRKRRQIEALADLHIAMWLASDDLAPGDRKRLEAEKQRRKTSTPEHPVGVLIGSGGCSPAQLAALEGALAGATEVHHPGVASRVHTTCKGVAPVVIHRDDLRAVVLHSKGVVALPTTTTPSAVSPVWSMVKYAKHRSLSVKVVLPDGTITEGAS
jgi:hypothetical protein